MALPYQQTTDLLKAAGFAGNVSPFECTPLTPGYRLVRAWAPPMRYAYMTDTSQVAYVQLSAILLDGQARKLPVGTLYHFDSLDALKSHLAATVHAIQHINERHLYCQACGGSLKPVPAVDRGTRDRFDCVRPLGSVVSRRGKLTCPHPHHSNLPVLVRYGSDALLPLYTELEPSAKGALMHKVWRALVEVMAQPAPHVAPADYPAWYPVPADCHLNARRWLAAYPSSMLVRGWLHEPFAHSPDRFVAHTIVRDRDGTLRDVTRLAKDAPLRFVPHPTDDIEFDRLVHAVPHRVTELFVENAGEV